MNKSTKNILIAIEGIDGSGKTTLAKNLAHALSSDFAEIILTREPGGSKLGQYLRKYLHERDETIDDKAEFLLFVADRAQHFSSLVIPALQRGALVISDRLADSSLAYQGYGRGLDINMMQQINRWAMQGLVPTITIYVRISHAIAMQRLNKRKEDLTAFEQEKTAFFERVIAGYEKIYQYRDDVMVIDGTASPDEVVKTAATLVLKKLHEYKDHE